MFNHGIFNEDILSHAIQVQVIFGKQGLILLLPLMMAVLRFICIFLVRCWMMNGVGGYGLEVLGGYKSLFSGGIDPW